MRIDGYWTLCSDGVLRPVFVAEALGRDGSWFELPLLADTGADRTVLSGDIFQKLAPPEVEERTTLSGLAGMADSVLITTPIRLKRQAEEPVVFNGQFSVVTDIETLDMSLLGRDITNLFTLIVDRPQEVVCLLSQRHRYQIIED